MLRGKIPPLEMSNLNHNNELHVLSLLRFPNNGKPYLLYIIISKIQGNNYSKQPLVIYAIKSKWSTDK